MVSHSQTSAQVEMNRATSCGASYHNQDSDTYRLMDNPWRSDHPNNSGKPSHQDGKPIPVFVAEIMPCTWHSSFQRDVLFRCRTCILSLHQTSSYRCTPG